MTRPRKGSRLPPCSRARAGDYPDRNAMRRPTTPAVLPLWMCTITLGLAQCGGRAAAPFADQVQDLGIIRHGDQRTHTFVLGPSAARAFAIKGTVTQCSCASHRLFRVTAGGNRQEVALEQYPLPVHPGDRIEVEVTVDTSLKDPVDAGPLDLPTTVHTDLEEHPSILLMCVATIRCPLLIRPGGILDLGRVGRRQTAVGHVDMKARNGRPFRVLGIEGNTAGLEIKPIGTLDDGTLRYELCSPGGREFDAGGTFVRHVAFRTDADGGYAFGIIVRALELTPLTVTPDARISFGRVDPARPATAEVVVHRHAPGAQLELSVDRIDVRIDDAPAAGAPPFAVAFEPLAAVHSVKVRLEYRGGITGRAFQGTLRLKSNDPDQPVLEIPFIGFTRD